ncbi:NAD(P)H nitroreductase [Paractinoplanes abujensis]|uniref:Nitroreductase n=1 Tax=Paractinoplanes abujensis TaxID=882441 RepID=A0A7W7CTY3_9ACTN|nr:nitroreductase [Actinoplanes abujensis]MBB4694607.1 nitroreductase [Actinoplanes abujensis]GID20178.1 NAD(P)H nitroreductase [Actinoplanes abujensis]
MTPLEQAAQAALHAPSVFNTQPWRWRIDGDTMELHADESRRLEITDRDGRLLLLSLGAALHHARTALAAAGWSCTVERLTGPGPVARIQLGAPVPPAPDARRLAEAIPQRRTDRRPFGSRTVTDAELTRLRLLVEANGAYLHVVPADQVPALAISAQLAGDAELGDPFYRDELREWTHRPVAAGDGVPAGTAVEPGLRRVPVRDFAPDDTPGLAVGADHDQGAAYVILFGRGDEHLDLLRGGEALSALLLAATADGLATAPLTDAVEVTWPRLLVRGLLADLGEPYVVVRLGYSASATPLPPRPRRVAADVIVNG